jgi:hypothetical protein
VPDSRPMFSPYWIGRLTLRSGRAEAPRRSDGQQPRAVTLSVQVRLPGFRRAEGKEKGKGVVARRGLKEAQSETAGR